ncbi:hypothetical protein F4678DRAFT_259166 [Xylaria arbuscula]|nr:hypothetical protein F4678DRAFT_259166 [Xylaria arbuscula]
MYTTTRSPGYRGRVGTLGRWRCAPRRVPRPLCAVPPRPSVLENGRRWDSSLSHVCLFNATPAPVASSPSLHNFLLPQTQLFSLTIPPTIRQPTTYQQPAAGFASQHLNYSLHRLAVSSTQLQPFPAHAPSHTDGGFFWSAHSSSRHSVFLLHLRPLCRQPTSDSLFLVGFRDNRKPQLQLQFQLPCQAQQQSSSSVLACCRDPCASWSRFVLIVYAVPAKSSPVPTRPPLDFLPLAEPKVLRHPPVRPTPPRW